MLRRTPLKNKRVERLLPPLSPKVIVVCSELSLGWLSPAFSAPYSMSKFALEGYGASLRQELSLLEHPVSVAVLNPGTTSTPMLQAQRTGGPNAFFERAAAKPGGTLFGPALRRGAQVAEAYIARNVGEPDQVAATVEEIVHCRDPLPRYVIGASFEMRYIVPIVPQCVLDYAARRQLR